MPTNKNNRLRGPLRYRTDLKVTQENLKKRLEEIFIPTENELRRELTDDELKMLCLRVPCCVNMAKWNSVHDYVLRFTRENRLQNRTAERKLRLLERAVNMHMEHAVYSQDEIAKEMKKEWGFRKLQNILLLDSWKEDRDDDDPEFLSQNVSTEENCCSSEEIEYAGPLEQSSVLSTCVSANKTLSASNTQESTESSILDEEFLDGVMCCSELSNNVISASPTQPSEPINETNNNFKKVENMFKNINSESLTIDSTLNSDVLRGSQSNPCTQENSVDFMVHSDDFERMPFTATSTQELKD